MMVEASPFPMRVTEMALLSFLLTLTKGLTEKWKSTLLEEVQALLAKLDKKALVNLSDWQVAVSSVSLMVAGSEC
jgi:hypothetical protein